MGFMKRSEEGGGFVSFTLDTLALVVIAICAVVATLHFVT